MSGQHYYVTRCLHTVLRGLRRHAFVGRLRQNGNDILRFLFYRNVLHPVFDEPQKSAYPSIKDKTVATLEEMSNECPT